MLQCQDLIKNPAVLGVTLHEDAMWCEQCPMPDRSKTTSDAQTERVGKKLCCHGKINTLDWYEPLPDVNVTLHPIHHPQLPQDEEE